MTTQLAGFQIEDFNEPNKDSFRDRERLDISYEEQDVIGCYKITFLAGQ